MYIRWLLFISALVSAQMEPLEAMSWRNMITQKIGSYWHSLRSQIQQAAKVSIPSKIKPTFTSQQFDPLFNKLYKQRAAVLLAAGVGGIYTKKDPLKASLGIAPALTAENVEKYPQFKQEFILEAIKNITTIDEKTLLALMQKYPESLFFLVQPVVNNFDTIPAAVVLEILKKYPPAAEQFVTPAIEKFEKINPQILLDIMDNYREAATYFVAPAAKHFETISPTVLKRILWYAPWSGQQFLEAALKNIDKLDPMILYRLIQSYPASKVVLEEKLRTLIKPPVGNI